MKRRHCIMVAIGILLAGQITAFPQGFINLNFERSSVSNITSGGLNVTVGYLTGWTTYNSFNYLTGDTNSVPYNDIALDEPSVDLEGTNNPYGPSAIQGKYSVYIQGGSPFVPDTGGASIGQTATIPAYANSMTYWGDALRITFNGHSLDFFAFSFQPNYTVWQADISAYAGQTGLLLFNAPWQTAGLVDNIQFSTTAVPEPGGLALMIQGALLIGLHRYRSRPNKNRGRTGWIGSDL